MDFENAVFACDFSEDAIPPYLQAKETFKALGITMHLVYVNSPDGNFRSSTEIDKRVSNFLKKAEGDLVNLETVNVVSDYSIEKGILNFSNVIGARSYCCGNPWKKRIIAFF